MNGGAIGLADRRSIWATRIVAVALVLVVAVAAVLLTRELQVRASQDALVRDAAALARGSRSRVQALATPPGSLPARALLPEAMRRVLAAVSAAPSERRQLLDQALALVDAAVATRAGWGEAQLARAYILAERDGPTAATTQAALARSYDEAPFLRDGAAWRVGMGLQHWTALSPGARGHWVEEAIWYSRSKPGVRQALFPAVRRSPAYAAFMTRWREIRLTDMDLRRAD